MKIYPVKLSENRNYTRKNNQPAMGGLSQNSIVKNNFNDYKKTAGYGIAAAALCGGIYYICKGKGVSNFSKTLAKSMNANSGTNVNPYSLKSVMSGDELLKILPDLNRDNYIYSKENAAAGIFRADLHSHSNHSDGEGSVKNLLNEAAEYADKLYAKTKQKFIFALTDHDTTEGVKEALQIISSEPKKYKNLKFVPAIEVSFAHSSPNSSNPCEMSELLVYGVNPYSEKVSNFLNNIKTKRENMVKNFLKNAGEKCPLTKFDFDEFSKYYEFKKYGNLMNIHWRIYHYVQTKHAAAVTAGQKGIDAQKFFEEIMQPNATVQTLKESGKLPNEINEEPLFREIVTKVSPHFENDKIIAQSENTFEEVMDAFKGEPEIFMSYAHPFYFMEHTGNIEQTLKYFTQKSKGLIKASESYHQAYGKHVNLIEVGRIEAETEKLNLLNTGGRDNHNAKLF